MNKSTRHTNKIFALSSRLTIADRHGHPVMGWSWKRDAIADKMSYRKYPSVLRYASWNPSIHGRTTAIKIAQTQTEDREKGASDKTLLGLFMSAPLLDNLTTETIAMNAWIRGCIPFKLKSTNELDWTRLQDPRLVSRHILSDAYLSLESCMNPSLWPPLALSVSYMHTLKKSFVLRRITFSKS